MTDPYVNYLQRYEAVKSQSAKVVEKLGELNQRVVLFYDETTNFVGMLISAVKDRQENIV